MKKVICIIICTLYYSNVHSSGNELGVNLRYGITGFSGLWIGGGPYFSYDISESGSIRISYIVETYKVNAEDAPFDQGSSMNQSELRAHYLFHASDRLYLGLGTLYAWHDLTVGKSITNATISNSWGIDLAVIFKVSKAFNFEMNYTFKYPELIQERRIWHTDPFEYSKETSKMSLNTFYLNLLFFFSM